MLLKKLGKIKVSLYASVLHDVTMTNNLDLNKTFQVWFLHASFTMNIIELKKLRQLAAET